MRQLASIASMWAGRARNLAQAMVVGAGRG